jgi:phosphoglycolate phosphatase-like HAD superfamily hydrolase
MMSGLAGHGSPSYSTDRVDSLSRRLILFDIDGTLIASNYAGRQVMSHALRDVYGTDGALETMSFAGRTDLGIITSVMAGTGLTKDEIDAGMPRVYDSMARKGETLFFEDNLVPCPGVTRLLRALRARSDLTLGLQTGNARPTALQKLRAAGLDPAWFTVGAFGSDAATREGLFPVAWNRAEELTGIRFSGHNTIVVGDAPGDITAAQANGAGTLGVASGFCTHAELAEVAPDHLLPDLANTNHVLTILSGS